MNLDFDNHGVEKCQSVSMSTLMRTIGYLQGTVNSPSVEPSKRKFALELIRYIEENLKDVLMKEESE